MELKPFNSLIVAYSNNGVPNIKFSELTFEEAVQKSNKIKNNKYVPAFAILDHNIDSGGYIKSYVYVNNLDKKEYDMHSITNLIAKGNINLPSIYLNRSFLLAQWDNLVYQNLSTAIKLVKQYQNEEAYKYELDNITLDGNADPADIIAMYKELEVDFPFELAEEFNNLVETPGNFKIDILREIAVFAENQIATVYFCNEIFEILSPEFI